jgi:hypothetical protein
MSEKTNAALAVARELAEENASGIQTLSTGVRARLVPVGVNLIRDAALHIQDPPVPKFLNEDKGREEENPSDPAYQAACAEAERRRENASVDALILFGVELADGVPEDGDWLKKLRFLAKRGGLDLDGFDLDDPLDRELLYKKYVAVGSDDMIALGLMSGISRMEVRAALDSFPGDTPRAAAGKRRAQKHD